LARSRAVLLPKISSTISFSLPQSSGTRYPVNAKHNYISIQVDLSVAVVRKQQQIKVGKLQLEDNDVASSQDDEE
jgi:hypothetical protein